MIPLDALGANCDCDWGQRVHRLLGMEERFGPWAQVFAGLLIGGALGNAYDRIRYGAVVDFLNMSCCGIQNPYAFNVADIFIFVGAIGLAIFPQPKKDG